MVMVVVRLYSAMESTWLLVRDVICEWWGPRQKKGRAKNRIRSHSIPNM